MMRSVAAGLGAATVLAVVGMMSPSGQAMLGIRPAATAPSVEIIKDPPVPSVPAHPFEAARPATPVRPVATVVPEKASVPRTDLAPRAVTRESAPVARPAPAPRPAVAAQPSVAQGGLGQIANVANILMNLPQVLSQTEVHPAGTGSGGSWESGPAPMYKHHRGDDHGGGDAADH